MAPEKRSSTKINGRPTRKDYTRLCKEVQAASTQEYVPYEGAEDNGYLVNILGSIKYMALTGLVYEKPEAKPEHPSNPLRLSYIRVKHIARVPHWNHHVCNMLDVQALDFKTACSLVSNIK